ncbi:hypothetical protein D3C84_387280 [compost metagenome]
MCGRYVTPSDRGHRGLLAQGRTGTGRRPLGLDPFLVEAGQAADLQLQRAQRGGRNQADVAPEPAHPPLHHAGPRLVRMERTPAGAQPIRKVNQPYHHAIDDGVLAIAGLWSTWTGPEGQDMVFCALLTKDAADTSCRDPPPDASHPGAKAVQPLAVARHQPRAGPRRDCFESRGLRRSPGHHGRRQQSERLSRAVEANRAGNLGELPCNQQVLGFAPYVACLARFRCPLHPVHASPFCSGVHSG